MSLVTVGAAALIPDGTEETLLVPAMGKSCPLASVSWG